MIGLTLRHDKVDRAIEAYVRKLHDVAQQSLTDATDAAQASAKATLHATTTRRTGDAEDNWGSTWFGPYERRLKSFSGHTGFLESGTRAHFIAARRVRFLRFQMNGVTMFRRSVNHPGARPRPFMALAAAAGQMALKASAQAGLDRIAKEF